MSETENDLLTESEILNNSSDSIAQDIKQEKNTSHTSEHSQKQTTTVMTTEHLHTKVSYVGSTSEDLKATIWSMISQYGTILTCTICGKTKETVANRWATRQMENHIESLHVDGVKYECDRCEKICRSKTALHTHTYNYHK